MPATSQALKALFNTDQLTPNKLLSLIDLASKLKSGAVRPKVHAQKTVVALVFFEPSTRTRFSFEMACHRLGLHPIAFTADSTTSMVKGESNHETLQNLMAMRPDLVVIRSAKSTQLEALVAQTSIPVVNAGYGSDEHPTQALLDAMTIFERRGQVKSEHILYVGDVSHSRVANSGIKVFKQLGAQVACCSPDKFKPQSNLWQGTQHFTDLGEAMRWATVCIGLRIQKERHGEKLTGAEIKNYIDHYRIDAQHLSGLSSSALIMHPGPFVPGEDFSEDVLSDPRCAVHDQVTNGVYMRMAVLGDILGISCS